MLRSRQPAGAFLQPQPQQGYPNMHPSMQDKQQLLRQQQMMRCGPASEGAGGGGVNWGGGEQSVGREAGVSVLEVIGTVGRYCV